jgi:hypothetical protein
MQRAVSEVFWDETKISQKHRSMINEDMGDPNGVLLFDETGFLKKGSDSVGVAKQYCGSIGKVENCQVGVFAAYASPHGYALVDKRLFIPEQWFTKDYACHWAWENVPKMGMKTVPSPREERGNAGPRKGGIADDLVGGIHGHFCIEATRVGSPCHCQETWHPPEHGKEVSRGRGHAHLSENQAQGLHSRAVSPGDQ